MIKFCSECGFPVEPTNAYCGNCGHKLNNNFVQKSKKEYSFYLFSGFALVFTIFSMMITFDRYESMNLIMQEIENFNSKEDSLMYIFSIFMVPIFSNVLGYLFNIIFNRQIKTTYLQNIILSLNIVVFCAITLQMTFLAFWWGE